MKSRFNEKKSTQTAGILLKLSGGQMNYMKLIKLMYIIDRESLKLWGHPISGDEYFSLPHGPIVSRVYDLIADEPDLSSGVYWNNFIKKNHKYDVSLEKDTTTESLSQADIELINDIYQKFGNLDHWQLSELTHTFTEWRDPDGSRIPIRYTDILRAVGREEKEAEQIAGELEDHNFFATLLKV